MPDQYYQEYGPIRRRRQSGEVEEPPGQVERPEPSEPRLRSARRTARPRARRRSLWGPLLVMLCIAAGVVTLPYAASLFASGRPAEGVTVQGLPVTGMSSAAVQKALEEQYQAFLSAPITLEFENQSWAPSLRDLGVVLDLKETAVDASGVGRRGDFVARGRELWSLWRNGGYDVSPRIQVNQATLQAYLTEIATVIEQPPRNAALSVAAGKVIPTPGQAGRQMLVDATARDILRVVQSLAPQTVTVRTRLLEPTLGDNAVASAARDAHTMLQKPLTLQQGERSWTWEPEKLAELLSIRTENGVMTISPDQAKLEKAVDDLAQRVDSGTAEPRVAFDAGRLTIVEPGQTGLKLQQAETVQAISTTLRLEQRTLPLPVQELQPQVTPENLATLGIVELIGEGKTSFAGSAPYRVTNIEAGARRMDGVLIAPDAEFSFNTQLGEVDEANGFVQGYAVIGNRTQLEWGGGVCQDSTTLFRAAFWAGLPITERHAHPFYISWYDDYAFPDEAGPGMDATIYTGVSDLKFVNDTGHWLLLDAEVDQANAVLAMRLYGTKPNRTVSVVGPSVTDIIEPPSEPRIINDASVPAGTFKQTDTARRGMDIAVYRVITENGEQREPELFFTRFKAWPNVFVRGTGQ